MSDNSAARDAKWPFWRAACGPSHHHTKQKRTDHVPLSAQAGYPPGSADMPSAAKMSRLKREVLAVLLQAGSVGETRAEVPFHLSLSWTARISELRAAGLQIESKRKPFGDRHIARYVLRSAKGEVSDAR